MDSLTFRPNAGRLMSLWVATLLLTSGCVIPKDPNPNGSPTPTPHHTPKPTPTPRPSPTASPCPGGGVIHTSTNTLTPVRIDNNILYFDAADLSTIFSDPSSEVVSATLHFTVTGNYHQEYDQEIELNVNGIKAFSAGGAKWLKFDTTHIPWGLWLQFLMGHKDIWPRHCDFDIGVMKLNGAERVPEAIKRIGRNKQGQLILALRGKEVKKLSEVSLEIVTRSGACTTATPTPSATPTPIPAPVTSIDSVNPTGATVNSSSVTFEFSGDQVGLSFECVLDQGASTLCSSPIVYSNLADGEHTFAVTAINASGVRDATPAIYSWNVDVTPPGVTITNASSLPTLTNSTSVTLNFTANDPSASFQCSLDGLNYSNCTTPRTYDTLSEGSHDFAVRAKDNHNNTGNAVHFQWVIDITPPSVSFVDSNPPVAISSQTWASFTFTADETATYECRLDQSTFASCSTPVSLASVADGQHQFQVRATDIAGNMGAAATYAWTVDTTAPILTISHVSPEQGWTSATTVMAEFAANEAATYRCSFDGSAMQSCTSPYSQPSLTEGQHEMRIIATDLAGNDSSESVLVWAMDFTNPTLTWGQMLPSAASSIKSTSFSAEVSASENVTLSCNLNGSSLGQTVSPVQLNSLAEGTYQIDVSGTDHAGNLSNILTHTFSVDLTAPNLSLAQSAPAVTSQNSNTLTFSANESSTFECSLDSAGFSLCASPMTVSGLADGSHKFEVRGTDLAGNMSNVASVTWTVDTVPPVVTALTLVVARNSVTVNWTTNEASTSQVNWGLGVATSNSTPEDSTLVTSHSVVVSGLSPSTIYTVLAVGRDQAGNAYISAKKQFRTSP